MLKLSHIRVFFVSYYFFPMSDRQSCLSVATALFPFRLLPLHLSLSICCLPRWTIRTLEHACRCSCRRVLQTAFVPASFGGFLQVDSSSCRSTEVTAGRQRVLQVVNSSCRRVPGGKNSRAKLIIKILYILFYLRCQ